MSGIVNLDKIASTHVENVVHTAVLENGMVGFAGTMVDGEADLHNFEVANANNIAEKPLGLHASVELMYENRKGLKEFTLEVGKRGRLIPFVVGDVVTISDNVIDGATVKDQYVGPVAGELKLNPSATVPTTRFVGQVVAKTTLGYDNTPATRIKVLAN